MQRIIALILFLVSFFVPGDMTKANVYPEKALTEGTTKAEFVFENKTGNRLEITVKVDSIQRRAIEDTDLWIDVPFEQYYNEGITNYKLYPTEKTTLHVEFRTKSGIDIPLVSGDYRITVSYKMNGYTDNQTGTATSEFTVAPMEW